MSESTTLADRILKAWPGAEAEDKQLHEFALDAFVFACEARHQAQAVAQSPEAADEERNIAARNYALAAPIEPPDRVQLRDAFLAGAVYERTIRSQNSVETQRSSSGARSDEKEGSAGQPKERSPDLTDEQITQLAWRIGGFEGCKVFAESEIIAIVRAALAHRSPDGK